MKARTMHRDRQPSFFVAKPVSVTPEKQKIWRSTCTVGGKARNQIRSDYSGR